MLEMADWGKRVDLNTKINPWVLSFNMSSATATCLKLFSYICKFYEPGIFIIVLYIYVYFKNQNHTWQTMCKVKFCAIPHGGFSVILSHDFAFVQLFLWVAQYLELWS